MEAGQSAQEVARRAREKAERQLRRAEMFERGAQGERATADALLALGPEWVSLHDHRWPGRRLANIDHVVIGPGGVFVIDTKNWSGDVRVADDVLRQNGRSREKSVAGAADAALAVAELAGPYAPAVHPVLCFTGERELNGWVRDVMVCSVGNLVTMLQTRERVLTAPQVRELATRLDASMLSATDTQVNRPRPPDSRPVNTGFVPMYMTKPRRAKSPRVARIAAVLAGAVLLVTAGPTLLPAVGDAVASFIVDTAKPEVEACETPAAAGDKQQKNGRNQQSTASSSSTCD